MKKSIFIDCQTSEFSWQLFYRKYEASKVKTYAVKFLRDY